MVEQPRVTTTETVLVDQSTGQTGHMGVEGLAPGDVRVEFRLTRSCLFGHIGHVVHEAGPLVLALPRFHFLLFAASFVR